MGNRFVYEAQFVYTALQYGQTVSEDAGLRSGKRKSLLHFE